MSPAVLGQPLSLGADTQSPGLAQLAVQIQQGAGKGGIPMVLSDQTAMLLLQQGIHGTVTAADEGATGSETGYYAGRQAEEEEKGTVRTLRRL